MSKNRIRFYVSLAIIFAVFSVIAFVVPFEHNAVFWLSYVFAAVAALVQIYSYPKAFDFEGHDVRSKFYGFPLARLTTIYLIAQLALSLLFMILGKFVEIKTWIPVVLYAVLLGVFAIGFIAADSMKEEVERQDTVHKARVDTMRALQSKSLFIASQCDDSETKKALNKLAESFRFSDPVSSDALNDIEATLGALVDELQSAVLEKDNAAAQTLCAKVEATLADRNRMCKLNK